MRDSEKRTVIDRYSQRLGVHGYDPRTLGWTKGKHDLRFHILLSQWDLTDATLLDFGCGFGDMYAYCRANNLPVDYVGIDINPELVAEGRRQFPDAALYTVDALADGLDRTYDYIVSSGVHNLKLSDSWGFTEETFRLFDQHAVKGFASNFLSNKVDYELADTFHADPSEVLKLAYRFSNRVILRNDYMPYEFTVFVDKRTSFDKSLTVYPEFAKFLRPANPS